MNDLKTKYEAVKSLAKEMMKLGNVAEYFKLLHEATTLKPELDYSKFSRKY